MTLHAVDSVTALSPWSIMKTMRYGAAAHSKVFVLQMIEQ